MIRKVISYLNKELNFYEGIKMIENQCNSDIIGSCVRYLQMCTIQETPNLIGRKICVIGEFNDDDLSMPLVSYENPILVADCDEILSKRFPSLYEREETKNN